MEHRIVIVGGGLIGLCTAAALARRGQQVLVLSERHPGEASPASAGMLAPSVERATGPAHDFAIASRDRFPSFLGELEAATGMRVPLNREGVLQLALNRRAVKSHQAACTGPTRWLDAGELARLEPSLDHAMGAAFTPDDGAVDNVVLLAALAKFAAIAPAIEMMDDGALGISAVRGGIAIALRSGRSISAERVVLAAGAWSGQVAPGTCAKTVVPARGQMLSWASVPVSRVVYGPRGYLVPRADGHTLAGSTMESVGFDAATTEAGLFRVRSAAEETCPALSRLEPAHEWAGLRPVTPDLLPIIGRDPRMHGLIHASGHSRNGVLLAPLTGDVVADLVTGQQVDHDLSQFRPDRFGC